MVVLVCTTLLLSRPVCAIHVSASDTIASDDTRLGLGSGLDRYRTIIETRGGTFQTRAGQAHWQLDVSIPIDGDR